VRKVEKYVESARIEADVLDDIYEKQKEKKSNYCVKLFSSFELDGHFFMVFEPLGISLYEVIKMNNYVGFPIHHVKSIAK
jgi:hypothetical protein